MKKIVLVTGASSDLGKEICKHLISDGNTVYGGVRDIKRFKSSKTLHYIKLDITSDADVKNAVKKIIKEQKKIDVLINCAGITLTGTTLEFTPSDYLKVLDTNTIGAFRLIKEVV